MTRKEATQIVAYLNAAFPNSTLERESVAVYVQHLTKCKLGVAKRAAEIIAGAYEKLPSIAGFTEVYRTEERRQARERAESHGLPEPKSVPPEESLVKLVEVGVMTQEQADRLLAASAGAPDPEEHAARVAGVTKGAA